MDELIQPDLLDQVLIVSPHDDDGLIGCGGVIWELKMKPIVIIVTNGALGYHDIHQKDDIVETRQHEALSAYGRLGIPSSNIIFLGYPDMSLRNYQNWITLDGQEGGYQKLFRLIRRYQPVTVFLPSEKDFHPDHKTSFDLGWVAAFQARETLMPEFGDPAPIKQIFGFQVWERLERVTHGYRLPEKNAQQKRAGLRLFKSQINIIDELEKLGTLRYDQEQFHLYRNF